MLIFSLGKQQIAVLQRRITAYLLKQCYGLFARGLLGGIYLAILGTGTGFMFVTIVGLRKKIWERLFKTMADDPDLEYLMVDGSIIRVHEHGAAKKTNKLVRQKVGPEVD